MNNKRKLRIRSTNQIYCYESKNTIYMEDNKYFPRVEVKLEYA